MLVLSCHRGEFLLLSQPSPGAGGHSSGKGSAACCKKPHMRSAAVLLTWPACIKLGAGVGLQSAALRVPGEGGELKRGNNRGNRGSRQGGEAWKLRSHAALKGEIGTGKRRKRSASSLCSPLLSGALLLPSLDASWRCSPLRMAGGMPALLSAALLLLLLSPAPPFLKVPLAGARATALIICLAALPRPACPRTCRSS